MFESINIDETYGVFTTLKSKSTEIKCYIKEIEAIKAFNKLTSKL